MNIDWNAQNYTNHFSFVHRYGEDVLKLIDAPAGSRVLDLGCGNGALTKKLKELGFQAQGMDASEDMLAVAREKILERIDAEMGLDVLAVNHA